MLYIHLRNKKKTSLKSSSEYILGKYMIKLNEKPKQKTRCLPKYELVWYLIKCSDKPSKFQLLKRFDHVQIKFIHRLIFKFAF